jgi:uncharacterized integral membrane protein (TIGR02327 family)
MLVSAISQFFVILVSIGLSWWALQAVRWEMFLKSTVTTQAKLLQIILSIIVGYELAHFIMEYASLF